MNLKELARGETWMTETERRLTRRFIRGMEPVLAERGVAHTPLLALRVHDVLVSYVLVRRLEAGLFPGTTAEHGDERAVAAVVEAVSRARERMRKAMKELEDACTKAGTPIDTGLADVVKPLLRATAGLAEEAEAQRKKEDTGTRLPAAG